MLDKDKSIEMKDIWKGEIQKAISELQAQYAAELDRMQGDMQKNFEMQVIRVALEWNHRSQYTQIPIKFI